MPREPDEGDEIATEFFYRSGGKRRDASLHRSIIAPVDFPINEKIMGPIREKYKKAYAVKKQNERPEGEP